MRRLRNLMRPEAEQQQLPRLFCVLGYLQFVCSLFLPIFGLYLFSAGFSGVLTLDSLNTVRAILEADTSSGWEFLHRLIASDTSGYLGRYVSLLSFGAQKYLGASSVSDFRLFNYALHSVNLFLIASLVLRAMPKAQADNNNLTFFLVMAVLAGWFVSPLFVSTVLYTVQRMTLLASLFGLLSIVLLVAGIYNLCARSNHYSQGVLFLSLGTVILLIALMSKENAVVIPALVSLGLIYLARQHRHQEKIRLDRVATLLGGGTLCVGVLAIIYMWPQFVSGYNDRPFSMLDRLFTQPIVVLDYLRQFLFPDYSRMGVFQDDFWGYYKGMPFRLRFVNYALFAILVFLSIYLWRLPKWRLSAFGLCFFFITISLESSIIPLELYFEHRFYFPSVGIVLCLVNLIFLAVNSDISSLKYGLAMALCLWVFTNVLGTNYLVGRWANQDLMAEESYRAHPSSERAIAFKIDKEIRHGNFHEALRFSDRMSAVAHNEKPLEKLIRDLVIYCKLHRELPHAYLNDLQSSPFVFRSQKSERLHVRNMLSLSDSGNCPANTLLQFVLNLSERADVNSASVFFLEALVELLVNLERDEDALVLVERKLEANPSGYLDIQIWRLYLYVRLGFDYQPLFRWLAGLELNSRQQEKFTDLITAMRDANLSLPDVLRD